MRKGTHFRARHRASYTLEAAVILPLLAGFFAFLLFFFRVLQVQTAVQTALYYAGRKTACEAGVCDSPPLLFAAAEGHLQKELRNCPLVDDYVAGGRLGISLLGSVFEGDYIELRADYYIKSKINIIKTHGVFTTQRVKSRKWTGDGSGGERGDYVYLTENGTVYHLSRSCRYLDLSIRTAKAEALSGLRNQDGRRYDACLICARGGEISGIVYVTDYGTAYHTSLSCSGIKRTIGLVPRSEVGNREVCSKCGQGQTH